jgi:hypothetical protein
MEFVGDFGFIVANRLVDMRDASVRDRLGCTARRRCQEIDLQYPLNSQNKQAVNSCTAIADLAEQKGNSPGCSTLGRESPRNGQGVKDWRTSNSSRHGSRKCS